MFALDDRHIADYLARISCDRPVAPTLDALSRLQCSHLLAVPFENLDIHSGVDIVLDPGAIHDKVVVRRRGGYCYELNSAFGALLRSLGFDVDMVSARVAGRDGELGPPFDHMALLVAVPDEPCRFLVDVGFGDAFTRPIPLTDGREQSDRDRDVRVRDLGDGCWAYEERRFGSAEPSRWTTQYVVEARPRRLAEFAEMNEHQQRSPDSHFRRQPVCSLLTSGGRVTVSADCLIESSISGERHETKLTVADRRRVLRERFAVAVDDDLDSITQASSRAASRSGYGKVELGSG